MISSIAQETPPRRFNMAAYCIAAAAATRPNAQALVVVHNPAATAPAEIWTFARLEEAVLRIAGGLKGSGLAPGARILIRLENTRANTYNRTTGDITGYMGADLSAVFLPHAFKDIVIQGVKTHDIRNKNRIHFN